MAEEAYILIGMPLPPNYVADTRVIAQLETWHAHKNVVTYYPSTGDCQLGQDKIVQFALHLKPRPSHILFVDYDVLPRNNTLDALLAHDKDIISGVYPLTRKCEIKWCLSKEDPFEPMPINDLPDNLFKAKTISNGMMLVKTEVFDKIEWPYFQKEFGVGTMTTGHDTYFCKKAMEAGYDLWVDPKLKCNHFKTVDLLGLAFNYVRDKEEGKCPSP